MRECRGVVVVVKMRDQGWALVGLIKSSCGNSLLVGFHLVQSE